MGDVRAESSQTIAATPEAVLAALADYSATRPAILPSAYSDYSVESGGTGEGTVFRYHLSAAGRERDYRMEVVEASAARLVEKDQGSSLSTTWTVTAQGASSLVSVVTTWQGAGGVGGFFEGIFAPLGVRRLQRETLANLERRLSG